MFKCPLVNRLELAASVCDLQTWQRYAFELGPFPVNGGNVAVTHDRPPQMVDTMICRVSDRNSPLHYLALIWTLHTNMVGINTSVVDNAIRVEVCPVILISVAVHSLAD
jgi:hypothetical protein